jgi:hypothetical protein
MSASTALLTAIITALESDATYMALIGSRLFDGSAPKDTDYPYTVMGSETENLEATHDRDGYVHTVTFHDYSNREGRAECLAIREARNDVLHNAQLTVAGWPATTIRYEFGEVLPEEDSTLKTMPRHGVSRYRVSTMEAA